jgi:hypothetical protein
MHGDYKQTGWVVEEGDYWGILVHNTGTGNRFSLNPYRIIRAF